MYSVYTFIGTTLSCMRQICQANLNRAPGYYPEAEKPDNDMSLKTACIFMMTRMSCGINDGSFLS